MNENGEGMASSETAAGEGDYRRSHLDKGSDYDCDLEAEPFDRYMTAREEEILLPLVMKLFPAGVPRYLDFACGTGRITSRVEPLAHESYGLDVSESMLDVAREKCPKTRFHLGDATVAPLAIEPVDLVTSFRLFGNAQDELRVGALRAIHRLLVPGGYLVLNNHRNPWAIHDSLLRLKGGGRGVDLSWRKLRRMLTDNGFQLVRTIGIGFWLVRWKHFSDSTLLEGPTAQLLEPLSRLRPLGPFSPDAVLLARRR